MRSFLSVMFAASFLLRLATMADRPHRRRRPIRIGGKPAECENSSQSCSVDETGEDSPLDYQQLGRGFVHCGPETGEVKLRSNELPEKLRALRMGMAVAKEKGRQPREKASGDDHALPNDTGSKHLCRRSAKRRQQNHQRSLSNTYAALRDRHHGGDLCQRPSEEPHPQR